MNALIAASLWGLAANLVGMLPHNTLHWNLARLLVLLTPVVVWLMGREFGLWGVLLVLVVVGSLFRLPLMHLFKHMTGRLEQE